jgi:tyrosinase
MNKYELGHSYILLVFLGNVPDDPEQWRTSPSFVGSHAAFVHAQGANYGDQAGSVIEGFVHLNKDIAAKSGLSSFEPSVVAPYLKDNLHWRVQSVRSSFCLVLSILNPLPFCQVDRTPIEIGRLSSLEIVVVSNTLTYEPGSVFPTVGEPEYHNHITHGRPGGARHA